MYESLFSHPAGVFAEFDRLQRELTDFFGTGSSSNIRSVAPGTFPSINVGRTAASVEIHAYAPGIDPNKIDLTLDRGVLTLSGERAADVPGESGKDAKVKVYSRERTNGRFMRAIALPDDVDGTQVQATYRDGVLRITAPRRQAAQPRRIEVQ